jgi:hypothetical protein
MKKLKTWEEKWEVLQKIEDILISYGFERVYRPQNKYHKSFLIDMPEHKSYIWGLEDGWWCEYPELNEIIEKYGDSLRLELNLISD